MKMLLLMLAGALASCEPDEGVKLLPINPKELIYRKGDVLAFQVDSSIIGAALVTDYTREADDSTHIWYNLVCTDYAAKQKPTLEQVKRQRLFGRRIESSIDPAGYFIGLDFQSVRNDCLVDNANKFTVIGRLPLDSTTIKIGSQGANSEYWTFIQAFVSGKEARLLPPDHYSEYIKKMDGFRPEEYFAVTNFLAK